MNVGHRSTLPEPPHVEPGSVCPACDRRVPMPRETSEPRKRAQVNIRVPADAEDGAEVLKALIDAARKKLLGALAYDGETPAYYVLVAALADWVNTP